MKVNSQGFFLYENIRFGLFKLCSIGVGQLACSHSKMHIKYGLFGVIFSAFLRWFLRFLSPLSPFNRQSVVKSVVTLWHLKRLKKREISTVISISQNYIFLKIFYFCSFIFNDVLYCSASGTSINSTDLSKFFITTAFISSSVTLKNSLR